MPQLGPISPTQLAIVARRDWDREIAQVGARQHGVITLAQLTALGMSANAARARASAGRLHRVHRGVFTVGHPPSRAQTAWMAAVLACGPGAVLSHCSAASLWRIRSSAAARIDVSSPRRAGRVRSGIRVHRGDRLPDAETTIVDGIPCTTVARTLLDVAALLSPEATEYAIHQAQARRLFNRADVIEVLERSPRRRGAAVIQRALGNAGEPEAAVRSELERRFLAICRRARLPVPLVNFWIALASGGGFEVDFAWPHRRLAVETDSRAYHRTYRAFENDPRRDRLLMLAGWRVARFTYRDLTEQAETVVAELRAMLAS